MQQYDGSGMYAGQEFVKSFFMSRLRILLPVNVGKTPEKGVVSQALCHFQILGTVNSLWGTIVFYHVSTGDFLIQSFYSGKFFLEIFKRRNFRHIRMTESMVPYCVSFFCHTLDQIRIVTDKIADYEESRRNLVFL